MGSKSITIPTLELNDLIGKDWVYKDRIYRFYSSGVLQVKSPNRQATFTFEIVFKNRYYLVIENEFFEANFYPTKNNELHLSRKKPLAKRHVLTCYEIQKITDTELDDIFKKLS